MTEIAIPDSPAELMLPSLETSPLMLWAAEAQQAAQIAVKLAQTSFVPASLRGKPADITAAILAGQELGLQPMATLRSMDVIQGTPALRAHAMRGLVQARGHKVELVESSPTRAVMRGKRKGERTWQTVEWTIQRAAQLGLTGKDQWKKQPQTMLIARATGDLCRLIASDVLYAMPYAAEELDSRTAAYVGSSAPAVTAEEILSGAEPVEPTAVEPGGDYEPDEYGDDSDDEIEHDGHVVGEYDAWCRGCIASREADRTAADQQ